MSEASETKRNQWIIGTAGHIDHGKSRLVRALTDVDTDTLPEEKARGISVDIGFAPLELGEGKKLAFVDVPGHERFIKNMVAGVHGIDALLLVVAVDQGVQQQTIEHMDICDLLGVPAAVVALSRADLLPEESREEMIASCKRQVEELFAGRRMKLFDTVVTALPEAADKSEGVHALKQSLIKCATELPADPKIKAPFRMYVDRVFSKAGFGTIVTGSVLTGRIGVRDKLYLHPGDVETTVRKVESFLNEVDAGAAGMRLALNLQHADVDGMQRGFCLTEKDNVSECKQLFVRLEVLRSLKSDVKHNGWVRLHWGTAVTKARLLFRGYRENA